MVAPGGRVLVADVGLNACMRQLIDSLWVTFVQDNWPFKSPEELNSPNGIVTAAGDTYAFAVTAYAVCVILFNRGLATNDLLIPRFTIRSLHSVRSTPRKGWCISAVMDILASNNLQG